ncbi:methyltransferase family protein [Nitratifractor sp.]
MTIATTPSVRIRIVLWIALLAGGIVGGHLIDRRLFPTLWGAPLWHLLTFAAGMLLMRLAFRGAARGGRELARSGRKGELPRLETDTLVVTGIYAQMRHPMFLALALIPPALALIVGSPGFLFFIAPVESLLIVTLGSWLEERECRRKFGEEYEAYARRVPPYCLRRGCIKALFGSDTRGETGG